HDEVEGVRALDLEPARAAVARLVGRVERLGHEALVAGRERALVESARRGLGGGDQLTYACAFGDGACERLEALAARSVGDALRLEAQAVEEERPEGQGGAHRLHIESAAEATHRGLERVRPSRGVECDRLAVEYERLSGKLAHQLHDLRRRAGHLVQAARVEPDLAPELVGLNTRAIHL